MNPSDPTWTNDEEESFEGGLRLLAQLIASTIRRTQQAQAIPVNPPQDAAA
jgi:hypothetical protein